MKLLLVDFESHVAEGLAGDDFEVNEGSFGDVYPKETNNWEELHVQGRHFPENLKEHDVFIFNLRANPLDEVPETATGMLDTRPFTQGSTFADPRALEFKGVGEDIEELFRDRERIFVVLTGRPIPQNIKFDQVPVRPMSSLTGGPKIYEAKSCWSFFESTFGIHAADEVGDEIRWQNSSTFRSCANDTECQYRAIIEPDPRKPSALEFRPVATNKDDECVAATIEYPQSGSIAVILPHFYPEIEGLKCLLEDALPQLKPEFFGNEEALSWTQDPKYRPERLNKLDQRIQAVHQEYRETLDALAEEKQEAWDSDEFLRDLLTGTGRSLVLAAKRALEELGFENVVDVDEEEPGDEDNEDLRLEIDGHSVLIEVKGISGHPSDAKANEVAKYIPRRMKQWGKTEVSGVTLINHQRFKEPANRANPPYRDTHVQKAKKDDVVLMTTWDLFRLVKNSRGLDWSRGELEPLFLSGGLFPPPLPVEYTRIGKVDDTFPQLEVVCFDLENSPVHVGDKLLFWDGVTARVSEAESIRVDDVDVDDAEPGDRTCVQISVPGSLPKNHEVYVSVK